MDSGWGTWLAGKKGTGLALATADACPVPMCPAEGKAPQMIQKRQGQLHAEPSVILMWGPACQCLGGSRRIQCCRILKDTMSQSLSTMWQVLISCYSLFSPSSQTERYAPSVHTHLEVYMHKQKGAQLEEHARTQPVI